MGAAARDNLGVRVALPTRLVGVYLEKRANLVRFFAARLHSVERAEDLAQDLYLKILSLPEDDDVQEPMALLYRIGANLMLDRLRQERRAAARDDAWSGATVTRLGGDAIVEQAPADEGLVQRERLRILLARIQDLPPRMSQAFRLHKLSGLSYAQTARSMGVSVSAVEKHISAALKALAESAG